MKKMFIACLAFAVSIFSATAYSAKGEYWEITTKMEMKGMPFAMPATTFKACIPPGEEKDPRRMQDKKSNCEFTDVKTSGNKVSFKGKCVEKDGTMYMEGENTYERDGYHGTMHMTGKSQGQDMDMLMTSSSKRIGGSCDAEEMKKKMQAQEKEIKGQMDKMCDTSGFNTSMWISSASMFIGAQPACKDQKEALCEVIRNDVPHDLQAYEMLLQQEQIKGVPSVVKACNANLESMKKTLCKAKAHSGPESFLDANCPAEAKAYRELARKSEDCEGRGYTSGEKLKKCMGGEMPEEDAGSDSANADAGKAKPNKSKANEEQKDSEKSGKENNPAGAVLDGAKKLKGLFGF